MLRSADQAGVLMLGICFERGLLATAHGGGVDAFAAPESGYWRLVVSDDPVLNSPWFQWHYNRSVVPPAPSSQFCSPLAGLDPDHLVRSACSVSAR